MQYDNMLTDIQARHLMNMKKWVIIKKKRMDMVPSDFSKGKKINYDIEGEEPGSKFLLRIQKSDKNMIKLSLHHQESRTFYCLVRIDYNGTPHMNPSEVNEYVPDKMKPYAGKKLTENHIHYHVEGYKSGAWAIPIKDDPIVIKEVNQIDFSSNLVNILDYLSRMINLQTKINVIPQINM